LPSCSDLKAIDAALWPTHETANKTTNRPTFALAKRPTIGTTEHTTLEPTNDATHVPANR